MNQLTMALPQLGAMVTYGFWMKHELVFAQMPDKQKNQYVFDLWLEQQEWQPEGQVKVTGMLAFRDENPSRMIPIGMNHILSPHGGLIPVMDLEFDNLNDAVMFRLIFEGQGPT